MTAPRPLLWMHAPRSAKDCRRVPCSRSRGARRRDTQLAYTYFSPSAVGFARSLDVDFQRLSAFDTPGDARVALDALRPTALVFSKLDVWPVITREAKARGVRLGLISATLARGSSRRSLAASALLRDAYAALEVVGAIDDADADRLVQLGVRSNVIVVTGDTRYDQVWLARAARRSRQPAARAPPRDAPDARRRFDVAGGRGGASPRVRVAARARFRTCG